jgi:hypothetical protein
MIQSFAAVVAVLVASAAAAPTPAPRSPLVLDAVVPSRPGVTIVVKGGAVDDQALLEQAHKLCAPGVARLVETTDRDEKREYRYACEAAG